MRRSRSAFTLIEIMMVVSIIALLSAIATPSYMRARQKARGTRFINDLRVASGAFEMYYSENKGWPAERGPGQVPPEMVSYLGDFLWTAPTPIGGQWDWDKGVRGIKAGVSVRRPGASAAEMAEIDASFDDGDVTTGAFRQIRRTLYSYILEQ